MHVSMDPPRVPSHRNSRLLESIGGSLFIVAWASKEYILSYGIHMFILIAPHFSVGWYSGSGYVVICLPVFHIVIHRDHSDDVPEQILAMAAA